MRRYLLTTCPENGMMSPTVVRRRAKHHTQRIQSQLKAKVEKGTHPRVDGCSFLRHLRQQESPPRA